MNCTEINVLFDDYVDGLLPASDAGKVAEHLQACPSCREQEANLRGLIDAAARLPRTVEPERDLWLGIRERIQAFEKTQFQRPARLRPLLVSLAAAALLVCAAGIYLAIAARGPSENASLSAYRYLGSHETALECVRDCDALRQVLTNRADRLSPETRQALNSEIQTFDKAMGELGAALAADPKNEQLRDLLVQLVFKEVRFLNQAAQLPDDA